MQVKSKEGQEASTLDGSVDWHGRSAIRGKSGGWFAGIIILRKLSDLTFEEKIETNQENNSKNKKENYWFIFLFRLFI